ncbi:MAG TPA: Opacity-associated protein A, partial [Erwiniaceae bacterium]|nr:Opacity-associated protein A [Erwiniaceae bacterium]
ANGVVTGLTVEGENGPVLFTRQTDGTFLRAQ